ncbi:MAG: Ig-like domain-containing protein [Granulosicoccaceae bacterium]
MNIFATTRRPATGLAILLATSALTACSDSDNADTSALRNQSNAPTAANQCLALADPGDSYTGQLAALVQDNDSDAFSYTLASAASQGLVDIDWRSGSYTYSPNTNSRGFADYFVYRVKDEDGETSTGVVNLVYGALRVMPVGDSITFGVERYTGATGDLPVVNHAVGYRQFLHNTLRDEGYTVDFVGPERAGWDAGLNDAEHAGFPGWRATELAYGRASDPAKGNILNWLEDTPADALLVHAGTNDNTRDASVLSPLLDRVQQWQANNHPVDTLLASIIDQRRDSFHNRAHLDVFNAGVENLAPLYENTFYVDQYSALDWNTDLSSYALDSVGLHPNTSGYRKMADKWFAGMQQAGLLNKCPDQN